MKSRFTPWCLPLTLALGVAGFPASAQSPDIGREAVAETLFQDGHALMKQGRYAEACPKLAGSHAVDPAGGTVLLLALCYEQVGKTASAWVKFNEALAVARRDGRTDRVKRAVQHIEKLEPMLSHVAITVTPEAAATEGLTVSLDGATVPKLAWSRELPADPGAHRIEAEAPGKERWSTTVELGGDGARQTVRVPALEDLPSAAPAAAPLRPVASKPPVGPRPAPARDTAAPTDSYTTTLAYLVGGVGILATSAGGYFGVRALDQNADARDRCPENECTDPAGVQLNESARTDALRANVLTGAGLVLVGVGAYLWLSAPDDTGTGTALVLQPDVRTTGLSIGAETSW